MNLGALERGKECFVRFANPLIDIGQSARNSLDEAMQLLLHKFDNLGIEQKFSTLNASPSHQN